MSATPFVEHPPASTPDKRLGALARSQAGVFTRAQAVECGLSLWQIDARLADGLWVALHPGIYCAGTAKRRRETRAIAGLLHCGEKALFSHFTAARLLGIDVPAWSDDAWILTPHQHRVRPLPGVTVSRTRHMPPESIAFGQPVTPPARTLVDLSQVLSKDHLRRVLYDMVRRKVVTVDAALATTGQLGHRSGTALIRSIAAEFDPAFESGLEAEAQDHFNAAGIFLEPQVEVWDGWLLVARLDFADRKRKLAIEIDGHRYHSTMAAQERDRRRDRTLHRLGWTVVRFVTDDVRRRPQQMVGEVREQQSEIDRQRGQ